MNDIQACDSEDFDSDDSYVPPTPKEEFTRLIAVLQQASRLLDGAYTQMIAKAAPFDKELVKKLEGAKKADLELFGYVKSKVEQGDSAQFDLISGLMLR